MTRRDYLYFQFSAAITFLIAACKHDERDKPPVITVEEKKLAILNVFPEKAVAGSAIEIPWHAENINILYVLTNCLVLK